MMNLNDAQLAELADCIQQNTHIVGRSAECELGAKNAGSAIARQIALLLSESNENFNKRNFLAECGA